MMVGFERTFDWIPAFKTVQKTQYSSFLTPPYVQDVLYAGFAGAKTGVITLAR